MGRFNDLTGKRFGRLTVVSRGENAYRKNGDPRTRWVCVCDCGKSKLIYGEALARGVTKSCGCIQKERASATMTKHGSTNTKLYGVWCSMKNRCNNKNNPHYNLYGGRGISVCDEWERDYSSFEKWSLSNGYFESKRRGDCTIDRIDPDKGYSPDNCRWVSVVVQTNNLRCNRKVECFGKTCTIGDLAREYNMPYSKLYQRITRYGYTPEEAVLK